MKSFGKFITFEGPEGSGKSTHIQLLATFLTARGIDVRLTREPGGTLLGESVRGLLQNNLSGESPVPRAEVMLFLASRAQLVEKVILPALSEGAWVLADRFDDSTFAYQGFGRGFPLETLRAVDTFATGGLVPDLTFLLDVPPNVSCARLAARQMRTASGPDRIESENLAFHTRLRDGFLVLAKESPERFVVIDSDRTTDAVTREIERAVSLRFFSEGKRGDAAE